MIEKNLNSISLLVFEMLIFKLIIITIISNNYEIVGEGLLGFLDL